MVERQTKPGELLVARGEVVMPLIACGNTLYWSLLDE